jgi:hypothetical protein
VSDDNPFGGAARLPFCLKPIKLVLQRLNKSLSYKPGATNEGPILVDRPFA